MAYIICPKCKKREMFHTANTCRICKNRMKACCKRCNKKLSSFSGGRTQYCKKCYYRYLAGSQLPHSSEHAKYARSFGRQAKVKRPRYCKDCGVEIKSRSARYCRRCCCAHRPNPWLRTGYREKMIEIHKIVSPRGPNHHWYRHGRGSDVNYAPGWTRCLRDRVKDRDDSKCVLCGSPKTLRVHHIDFGKTNHNPNNLATVCMSCHSKIHALFDPRDRRVRTKAKLPRLKSVNSVKTFIRQYRAKLFPKGIEGVTTRSEPKFSIIHVEVRFDGNKVIILPRAQTAQ